ncbi:SDR family oxidoreductase [Endozoicomonas atrinae]|uniref:SDR family oxidoreductase n=1 Tax=Endozoicomonas atrinae TaxID=1333660 RepID=UPI0008270193|nr:SDR family oxidoreductase [Endozoicomonas atrinae]
MGLDKDAFGLSDRQLAELDTVFSRDSFSGKRVLISGGGSGIGKAAAWLLARLGAKVLICGRSLEKLQAAIEPMKEMGLDIRCKTLDIRDPDRVQVFFDEVMNEQGGLDVLINNAGGQFPQPAIDFSPNGWRAVIDNNLNGTWFMMQAAAQRWRDVKNPGNIINIVTVIDRGMPDIAHTCAARAGVIYASKTVAVEWAQYGIRVNCIAPGIIASEGMKVYPQEAVNEFPHSNPMQRFGSAWDIAQACAYLGSDASQFMTGEVMTLDGGGRLWGELWPYSKPEYFS